MKLQPFCTAMIIMGPLLLAGVMVLLLTTDATRGVAMGWSRENGLIELVTAGLLLLGGVCGVGLSLKMRQAGLTGLTWGFVLVFSAGLLLVGMEELAWGQTLLGFETPEAIERVNQQQQMTLHNLPGLHGRSEVMWLMFAVAGLIGIGLRKHKRFEFIAPEPSLAPWFLVVLGIGLVMGYRDLVDAEGRVFTLVRRMDEFTEMLISMAGCLHLLGIARRLVQRRPEADPPAV